MKRKKKNKWKLVLLTKLAKLGEYKGRNEKKKKEQMKNGVNVFCRTRTVEEKKIRINEKWCCEVSLQN
jgi:hypothetical protein